MDHNKQKKISTICDNFNRQIARLIKLAERDHKDDINLYYVKRGISLVRQQNPALVLEKCIDKLWENKTQIIDRDVKFFVDNMREKAGKFIKDDHRADWLYSILEMLKREEKLLKDDEREYIWDCINKMLEHVVEYRIIMGDFV